MIAVTEDGGYISGMVDRLRDLEAPQDEFIERFLAAPADPRTSVSTSRTSNGAWWRGLPCAQSRSVRV